MAKHENEKQPQSSKQQPLEEPEEIVEIVDDDVEDIIEVIDETEPKSPAPEKANTPTSGVDLGAPVRKLDNGSDIIEVEDAEMEFVDPASSKKKLETPPASGKQLASPLGPEKKPTAPAGKEQTGAVPPKPLMPRVKKPAESTPTAGSEKTVPGGKRSTPTMVASHQAAPTMLAPQEASEAAQSGGSEGQPPESKQEDAGGKRAAATKIAARQASPTMLAPQEEGSSVQSGTEGASPAQPAEEMKKPAAPTKIASRQAHPTMMAPSEESPELTEATAKTPTAEKPGQVAGKIPDMELGESEPEEVHEITEVDELIDILDEDALGEIPEGSSVRKAGPGAEDLNVFDLVDEAMLGPGSSVIDLDRPLSDKSSGVDIIAEELESQVGMVKPAKGRATPEEIMEEEAIGHEVGSDDSGSSAVDLGAAGGIPPSPLDIEDIYATEADMAAMESSKKGKKKGDLDETQPYDLGEGAVVVDESLLVGEGEKADEVSIEDLMDLEKIDDEEAQKQKGKSKEPDYLAAAEEEAEEAEVAVATKTKAKTKAAKKKATRDEEEGEDERPSRPKKPRYLRRLVGGTVLGLLLATGALGAVWFLQPDLLGQFVDSSPNKSKPIVVPVAKVTPTQLAAEHLNRGELDEAWALVENAGPGEDEKLAMRGQIQWLKYFQKHGDEKIPMKKDDPEVVQALKDLEDAKQTTKSDLYKKQILIALDNQELQKKVNENQGGDKALKELLVSEKLIPPMPDPKLDLAKVVAKVIADKKAQDSTLATIVKEKGELDKKVMQLQMTEQGVKDLLVKENIVKKGDPKLNDVSKVIAQVIMEKKNVTTTLNMVNAKLKDAKIPEADVKGVEKLLALRDKVEKDYVALNKAAEAALKEITEGKGLKPGADISKQLVEDAKLISEKAKAPLVNSMSQMVGTFRDLSGGAAIYLQGLVDKTNTVVQLKFFEGREPLIETPEKKVENWIALFQNRAADSPKSMEKATKDANWVSSSEAKATPEAKARAVYLQGLLARHRQQFTEAKAHFAEALKQASAALKPEPAWVGAVNQAMKELTDPKEYYLPTAQKLQQTGQYPAALAQLNTGLKALPGDPNLLLQRAMLNLEQLPAAQPPSANQQKAIRDDAEAAKKNTATAAKANYVLGQLEERLGDLAKAKSHYEQALASLPKENSEEANLYRLAIGRLLLTDPSLTPAAQPAISAPKTNEVGMHREPSGSGVSPLVSVVLLTLTMGDPVLGAGGPNPAEGKKDVQLKKLMELAEEYKKSENPKVQGQGYMLLGVAQSEMGKRTQGLLNYIKGMKLFYPGIEASQLQKLIDAHPAFQVPDSLTQPNPLLAEHHFGNGLHLYFEREYEMAEEQFKKAIGYHKNDARYHYFLGLSQYAQSTKDKKTAADHNITQGANLEIQDLPPVPQISLSLERIQGPVRDYLSSVKARAKLGGP